MPTLNAELIRDRLNTAANRKLRRSRFQCAHLAVMPHHPARGTQRFRYRFLGGETRREGTRTHLTLLGAKQALNQSWGPLNQLFETRNVHNINTDAHNHASMLSLLMCRCSPAEST